MAVRNMRGNNSFPFRTNLPAFTIPIVLQLLYKGNTSTIELIVLIVLLQLLARAWKYFHIFL